MKVIFLDIDGVLNCGIGGEDKLKMTSSQKKFFDIQRGIDGYVSLIIDQDKVKILGEIVKQTNAKIVLASSLRFDWANGKERLTQGSSMALQYLFDLNGVEVVGITPMLEKNDFWVKREDEIKEYLKQHKDIESFIVIDDYADQLQSLKDFLIDTARGQDNKNGGLQEKHIEIAVGILGNASENEIEK